MGRYSVKSSAEKDGYAVISALKEFTTFVFVFFTILVI